MTPHGCRCAECSIFRMAESFTMARGARAQVTR